MPQSHVRTLIYRTWPVTKTSPNNAIVADVKVYILLISMRLRKEGMMLHTNGHDTKFKSLVGENVAVFVFSLKTEGYIFLSRVQNVWVTKAQMNS